MPRTAMVVNQSWVSMRWVAEGFIGSPEARCKVPGSEMRIGRDTSSSK
jgi:hypothetical protein